MCFKVLTSSLVVLIYMNSINAALMSDAELLDVYNKILREKSIDSVFCHIPSELWASCCTHAVKYIAEESVYYEHMYLDYPLFRTDEPDSDKCQDTKLFIPVINEYMDLKHLICHGRPIIIGTDKPIKQFSDTISIYILNASEILILEKVNKEEHKLLKLMSTQVDNISVISVIDELLTLPSPRSTFDQKIIKGKMGDAESTSRQQNENHMLKNIPDYSFLQICYMIFSRSEYADEVKLLPKREIQKINRGPRKSNCFLFFFSNVIKFKVTMYTCPIFEKMDRYFKLIAGPNTNSIVVVKFAKNGTARPYELIENIYLKFLDFLVRI